MKTLHTIYNNFAKRNLARRLTIFIILFTLSIVHANATKVTDKVYTFGSSSTPTGWSVGSSNAHASGYLKLSVNDYLEMTVEDIFAEGEILSSNTIKVEVSCGTFGTWSNPKSVLCSVELRTSNGEVLTTNNATFSNLSNSESAYRAAIEVDKPNDPAKIAYLRITFSNFNSTSSGTLRVKYVKLNYETSTAVPCTVTLMDDNTTLSQLSVGDAITLPSRDDCDDYTFAGWTSTWTSEQSNWTTTKPTIINAGSYTPTEDENLYPVYTKTEGGGTAYEKVTTLTEGVYVMVSEKTSGTYKYMPNTTSSSSNPTLGSGIIMNNDKTSLTNNVTEAMLWDLTATGTADQYYLRPHGSTTIGLGCNTTTGANIRISDSHKDVKWTITTSADYGWQFKSNASNPMYLAVYSDDNWRNYTSSTTNQNGKFYLFKQTSSSITSYISVPDCDPCNALQAPNVTAKNITTNSFTLSWAAVPGAISYNIYNYTTEETDETTDLTYTFNELDPNTEYKWEIEAVSATCNGKGTTGTTTTLKTYTITWKNADGSVLETDENVPHGTTPTYNGATPTKTATAQYTYTFSDWSPTIYAADKDQVYTAQFSETLRQYTVTFNANGHGTAPDAQEVDYNKKATEPSAPTATGYTFGGWYKESGCTNAWNFATDVVTGNVTLYAKWTEKPLTRYRTDCDACIPLDGFAEINGTYHFFPGETITLTVTPPADAVPYTYQWQKRVDSDWTDIADATATTYTKDAATIADAGRYRCVVSSEGYCDTIAEYNVKCLQLYVYYDNKSDVFNAPLKKVDGATATIDVELQNAGYTYYFKITDGCGNWYGFDGDIHSEWCTDVEMNADAYCGLKTTKFGTYVFNVKYSDLAHLTVSVIYPAALQEAGKEIYLDNNVLNWTHSNNADGTNKIYYRIGRNDHNNNIAMTLVPGTANLYKVTTGEYDNFDVWHIANNGCWSNNNSIYQTKTGDKWAATQATAFETLPVTLPIITVTPTTLRSVGGEDRNDNCEFYNYDITEGMKKHQATVIPATGGTISVSYTDHDGTAKSDFTSGDRDLAHTCLLTITATPDAGYKLTSLTVNDVPFTSGNVHTLSADAEIEVVWEKKIETALSWSAPTCTATIASPSNEFPTLTVTPEAIRAGVQYSSSIPAVATIDATGRIVLKSAGTTTIRAYYEEDNTYASAEDTYELTVEESTNCRWEEVTIDDIEYGDEVVIAMTNGATTWALDQDYYNSGDKYPLAATLEVNGNEITQTYDKIKWNISGNATDGYILHPNGQTNTWLYCTGSNNTIKIGDGSTKHFVIENGYLKSKSKVTTSGVEVDAFLGVSPSTNSWRHYPNTTTSVISGQTLKFYKKVCLPENEYWVDFDLENVTCISDLPKIVDASAEDLLLYFTTAEHYELPATISVEMGGLEVENNEESYIWSQNEGGLLLKNEGVTDNLTISIAAQLKKYTVSFNMNGQGSAIEEQQITAGGIVSIPNPPIDDSHNFLGWFADEGCRTPFDFSTLIYAPTTIYAKWEIKTFTITYAKGSPAEEITGSHDPGTKTYGTGYTLADESFYREDYKQTGWAVSDGGEKAYDLLGTYGGNADITLYPVWTKVHTVTWMADGEQYDQATYLDGLTLELPETKPVPCQGSAFMGWTATEIATPQYNAPTYVNAGSSVTTDATYYAVYAEAPEGEEDATYTLVTTANDFTDGIYVIAAKSNDYFYFINGQYVSDGLGVETTGLASNLVNDNSFAASFLPGGAVELDIEDDGDPLGDNYYFISYYDEVNSKWLYLDDNGTKQSILWTDADEVYTYLPIFDNGEYYLQSGSGAKISQNGSNKASFIRNYASTGSFYNSLYFFKKSAGSIIYTNYSTNCTPTYYITYDLNGGEGSCENGSVPADENYTICAHIPTKTGYDFVGWSTADDNEAEFLKADVEAGQAIIENVSNNVELYAVWKTNIYEITWWSNGVEYTTTSHTFDTELQLPADPYTCYGAKTFIGWTEAETVNADGEGIEYITTSTNPSDHKTYYAVFADEEVGEPEKHDATLSFADKANRTSQTSEQQVWEQNGITLTNNKASSANNVADYANPARFYANSSISIVAPGNITKIVFTCVSGYATAMKNSAGNSASVDGNNVTVNLDGSSNTFDIASVTAQIRLNSLTVTYQYTPEPTLTNYTTTPSGCAEMEVAENAYVTSAKDQRVKVNVPIAVNFQDGYTIDATLNDGTKFEVVKVSEIVDDKAIVTLAYSPDYSNNTEKAEVKLTAKYGENFVTAKSFTLNGRSLPETFAVVAKVGNMWYALPEVGYEAEKHATAYPVEVDDIANPTTVTSAVANNAAWSLRQVYQSSGSGDRYAAHGTNIVMKNNQDPAKALNASEKDSYLLTGAQFSNYHNSDHASRYEWTLSTEDLVTYTMTNAERTNKQINISKNAVFGLHASGVTNQLRFLPIAGTYTAIDIQVVEWYADKVLIRSNSTITAATAEINGITYTAAVASKDNALYEISKIPFAANPAQVVKMNFTVGAETLTKIIAAPVILSRVNLSTTDDLFSNITKEVYNYTDLVVRDGSVLTVNGTQAQNTFYDVTIYPTAKIVVPEKNKSNANNKLSVNSLTFIGGITEVYNGSSYELNKYAVPELSLKGTLGKTVTTIDYLMRVDLEQMYSLALPYDVALRDITYGDGSAIELGTELYVSAYNGATRAENLAANNNWVYETDFKDVFGSDTLKAGVGYTISAEPQAQGDQYAILRLPMKSNIASGSTEADKSVTVTAHGADKNIADNHKGWNLIANPYMTSISGDSDEYSELMLRYMEMLPGGTWQWTGEEQRYVTIPYNDGSGYYQLKFSEAVLQPFKNFFVQVGTTGDIDFVLAHRQNALARYMQAQKEREVEFELLLGNGTQSDNTGLLIAEKYSPAYEINADLEKMTGNMSVFTIYNGYQLAYNALSPINAEEQIPVGYIVPAQGEYTFDLKERGDYDEIEHIYLTDRETDAMVDLLEETYTFYTTDKKNNNRFAINVILKEESHNQATDLDNLDFYSKQPQKFLYDGRLYILRDGKVYSATGHEIKTINE